MRNLILTGATVFFLGSCCVFEEYVEGDGKVITREYAIADFDSVELAGIGRVILTSGDTDDVTAIAEENILDHMTLDRRNGGLLISQDDNVILRPTQEPLFLITSKNCERLHLSGAGDMTTNGPITTNRVSIILEGSGDIQADLAVDEVITVLAGSGGISLSGSALHGDHTVQGAGNIDAFGLSAETTDAVITGAGDIRVTVASRLNAVIYGSGDIVYQGGGIVSASVYGAGSVRTP